jgi:diphthine synthase
MLYLVGLGLNDEYDISVRGLELVRGCSEVLLEAYTSVLTVPVERLEALYGRKVTVAERDFVESGIEPVLERAKISEIALLVVGDPFGATTHCDVLARAKTCVGAAASPAPSPPGL